MEHYYGDIIRKLFLAGGIIMLLGLPFVYQSIPSPLTFAIFFVLVIIILAGFLSPRHRRAIAVDVLVAAVCLGTFEYYAINAYLAADGPFFFVNQVLAFVFFFALYYGTKTLRGIALYPHEKERRESPAIEVLKMQYASGDIRQKEFEKKLEHLRRAQNSSNHHEEEIEHVDSLGNG